MEAQASSSLKNSPLHGLSSLHSSSKVIYPAFFIGLPALVAPMSKVIAVSFILCY